MKENFNISKLKNGLTILTYNMPYVHSVAINLIAKVGARYENEEEEGISHFLEHMAFKGTKTRTAQQIAEEFDSIGGYFNAYTGYENTVYYVRVLSENCHKALNILADIIQNSIFADEEISKEYQIIMQEIAHHHDNPDDLIYETFYNTVYKDQPLGKSILGTAKTLVKFTQEHFLNFIGKHYNAENLYLSIAGNIEHNKIVIIAEELFASLKQGVTSSFIPAKYIGGKGFIHKELEQTSLVLGFECTSYINLEKLYQTYLLSIIFGGGVSSRLFQSIREKLGLAYVVGSYNSAYFDSGVFTIYASTAHEKLELLYSEIKNEIIKITETVSTEELMRAKIQLRSNLQMAQEQNSYKSEEIGKNYSVFGKYILPEEIIEIITNIKADDIINTANKIFSGTTALAIIGPNDLNGF
ncbi:M16 family metallopeptidase [Rickettsia typhi]|uniref:Uncharacterized zinc protease RT0210 n=2 Tax=Rickettsia typhi TaxID=785 RepID=Y210_RICTY|nr:pitrilysin family protein [Rickettsia typhi]Q68XF0.1 RecName: Full=Uncharacterized zinc protease RT0210 [Rickettsia typhi str. Wilmington]AAU03692.1 probable mitochondrial protease [Rickettsia typhi str. Wilmington]AFE54069.1 protease [Rickettsia typhi str. TH1527]AFE54908.1 protease [Rickettsia typhi str. B9991CWPP]